MHAQIKKINNNTGEQIDLRVTRARTEEKKLKRNRDRETERVRHKQGCHTYWQTRAPTNGH